MTTRMACPGSGAGKISGLRQAQVRLPDLIVLDLMLPERDGLDITRIVCDDEALAQ